MPGQVKLWLSWRAMQPASPRNANTHTYTHTQASFFCGAARLATFVLVTHTSHVAQPIKRAIGWNGHAYACSCPSREVQRGRVYVAPL